MRLNTGLTGSLLAGLAAGVIYFIIAFATGASAASSSIGGIAVALIASVIGLVVRVFFNRRALAQPGQSD